MSLTSLKVYDWKSVFILMPFFSTPGLLIPGHSSSMEHEVGIEYSYQRQGIWPQTDWDWNPRFEHLPCNSSKLMLVSLFGAKTLLTQRVNLNIQLNNEQKPNKYNNLHSA